MKTKILKEEEREVKDDHRIVESGLLGGWLHTRQHNGRPKSVGKIVMMCWYRDDAPGEVLLHHEL